MRKLLHTGMMCTLLALTACGGSSVSPQPEPPPVVVPPPTPNSRPIAQIATPPLARTGDTVQLDGSASSDADGDALQHAWSITARPAGSTAAVALATAARTSFVPDLPGSYTLNLVVSDGKLSSEAAQITLTVAAAPVPLAIELGKPEPLEGTVRLSLSGTVAGPVTWYLNLTQLGTAAPEAGAPYDWNTLAQANGQHQLRARVQTSATTFEEVSRTVTIANSPITYTARVDGTRGNVQVIVTAASTFGIASVSVSQDGKPLGSMTEPNVCDRGCRYVFTINGTALGSGQYSATVTITDGAGNIRQTTLPVPITNAPALALASPADGALAHDRLQIRGSAVSDRGETVTVKARLGDVQFLDTTASPFEGQLSLAGLPPGPYTLTVQATDAAGITTTVQRKLNVTGMATLAAQPALTLPADARVLLSQDGVLLFQATGMPVVRRDLATGAQVELAGTQLMETVYRWQTVGGQVFAQGRATDCSANFSCIYQWLPDGTRRNLSLANPFAGSTYQQYPVATRNLLAWVNDGSGGSFTLHNPATGSFTQVRRPAGSTRVGNTEFVLNELGGVAVLHYWAVNEIGSNNSPYDIYEWRSDRGTSVRLTDGSSLQVYPQSDGERVAWIGRPLSAIQAVPHELRVQAVAGGAISLLTSTLGSFVLRDGVLAWTSREALSEGTDRLSASRADGVVHTVSSVLGTVINGAANGQVLFTEGGRLYTWDAATQTRQLRADVRPDFILAGREAITLQFGQVVVQLGW